MAIARPAATYDCNGRWAVDRSYVYVLMARDGDGPMYVKIGRSDNPMARVGALQTGCPFRFTKAGMVKCLSADQAKRLEAQLHHELSACASSGEWFRFDWSSERDRHRLLAAMNVVFAAIPGWTFEEIDLERAAAITRHVARDRQRRYRSRKSR